MIRASRTTAAVGAILVMLLGWIGFQSVSNHRASVAAAGASTAAQASYASAVKDLSALALPADETRVSRTLECQSGPTYVCIITKATTAVAAQQWAKILGMPLAELHPRHALGPQPGYLVQGRVGQSTLWAVVMSHQVAPGSPATYSGTEVQLMAPSSEDIAAAASAQ